jgi:beta-galactosidase GanA
MYGPKYYYHNAHKGMYRLACNENYNVEYVNANAPEKFKNFKVLYFPHYSMLKPEIVPYLQKFMENGGIVIADEGFGMRTQNTWMQPYDIDCKPLMTARLQERRMINGETFDYNGESITIVPYKSEYSVENATVEMRFANGAPAMQSVNVGKGKLYLCGFSIGYSYLVTQAKGLADFMNGIFEAANVKKYAFADVKNGIYEKRLQNGDKEIVFLFNNSDIEQTFDFQTEILAFGGDGTIQNGKLCIHSKGMAYAVIKK